MTISRLSNCVFCAFLAVVLAGCGGQSTPREAAQTALAENDLNTARIHLITALEAEPESAELRLLYARTLADMGDGIAAEAAIEKLPASVQNSPEALSLMAQALLLQEKYQDSLVLADEAGPDSALGQWVAVGAMLASGQEDSAYARIDSAQSNHPNDARLAALRGEMALRRGHVARATEQAGRALESDPRSLGALMLAGRIALLQEDFETAEKRFASAVDSHPTPASPLVALAATQADLGKVEQAEATLERLHRLAPKHPLGTLLKAKLAFVGGDIEGANQYLQSIDKVLRDVPAAQLLAGEIDHLRGNHESAIVRLEKFMQSSPAHIQGATVLAQSYLAVDDAKSAWQVAKGPASRAAASPQLIALASRLAGELGEKDIFEPRLADGPLAQDAHLQLARADKAISSGKWEDAAEIYRTLRAQGFSNNALVLNNSAYAELETGNKAQALKMARQAHSLVPNDPQVSDTLGWMLLETGGASGEALELIGAALAQRPTDFEVRWHYAVALARNGRKDDARKMANGILEFANADQRRLIENMLAKL